MNSTALVLVYTAGAGLLALWVEARFGRLTPETMRARFVHCALAFAAVQLAPVAIHMIVRDTESGRLALFGLLYVFLPAVVYAFLTSIWLMKLVAGGGRPA